MFHLSGALLSMLGDRAAYLDPGSGSFLLQLLLAALLGVGLALRASWSKVKGLFRRSPADEEGDDELDEEI
ncbi:MAG: hypothetical protein D6770_11205 [Anaerolineae bacterium]|nr:MAG: hypothetical protein D6770_11205 [Anaerolineae bacterium]